MKALDALALESILEGDPAAKVSLRALRGHEVATTEIALLELSLVASRAPKKARAGRRVILERLRQKLTVLPLDARAAAEAARRAGPSTARTEVLRLAEWGILEAAGCEELFTASRRSPPGPWKFKVSRLGVGKP